MVDQTSGYEGVVRWEIIVYLFIYRACEF